MKGGSVRLEHRTIGLELLKKLLANEEGATIMEYALICTLIVVVCIVAISVIGKASSQSLNAAAVSV
ncbi:MAG: Flp family type IVb pilin [Vulcanimicrobiaceae bacterium]